MPQGGGLPLPKRSGGGGGEPMELDQEGIARALGELFAANRAMQANLDAVSQQFPIQPSSVADSIPDFSNLEEGGLMFMGPEGPEALEPGEPGEVLEAYEEGGQRKLRWAKRGGMVGFTEVHWVTRDFGEPGAPRNAQSAGMSVTKVGTGIYWIEFPEEEFPPADVVYAVAMSGVSGSEKGVTVNVDWVGDIYVLQTYRTDTGVHFDANFHFFAAKF